jgi:hypothetical protein
MSTYQLFMGRDIPGGGYVNDTDWQKFLHIVDTIVDGYTVVDADGVWLGVHEDCKVMTISTDDIESVREIANVYKQAFDQMAVGITTLPAMEFV